MSYTPINWQNGDTITAEKMNKMDNGWSVESSSQTLFSETVTTETDPEYPDDPAGGALTYSTQITAETVIVTFNGTDYTCQRQDGDPGSYAYGGWSNDSIDFTTFPFCIFSEDGYNSIVTETAGTYTISASTQSNSVETSSDFQTAVNSVVDASAMPLLCVSGVTTESELTAAATSRLMFFKPYSNRPTTKIITGLNSSTQQYNFIPEDASITASIQNGVFNVAVTL